MIQEQLIFGRRKACFRKIEALGNYLWYFSKERSGVVCADRLHNFVHYKYCLYTRKLSKLNDVSLSNTLY